jgi:hypothetical protein
LSQLTEAKIRLKTALGSFRVKRLPTRKSETLQAWDAADELLIDNLATEHALVLDEQASNDSRLLVINDQFGALTTSLQLALTMKKILRVKVIAKRPLTLLAVQKH